MNVIATLVFLCGVFVAAPQDAAPTEADAIRDLKRAYATGPRAGTPEQREAALEGLTGFDSEKVAKALTDAHADLESEIDALGLVRVGILAEIAKLQQGQEFAERVTLSPGARDRVAELRAQLQANRAQLDGAQGLHAELRQRIANIRDADAVEWMIANVLGTKKHTLLLRLAVARAAGAMSATVIDELKRVFDKAKQPGQLVALLDGVTLAGKDAAKMAPEVLELLDHKEEAVRERAAIALAHLGAPEAVEPLIDMLERETGRTRDSVAAALEKLTEQRHGVLVNAWRAWYADQKAAILAGDAPLGGGMFERRSSVQDKGYYFDIAMEGKSILYIIDSSGSMKEEIELKLANAKEGQAPVKQPRLDACKAELIGALGRLEPAAEFNVMWYNDLPYIFSEVMQPASKAKVQEAQDWIRKLTPRSSTNIYDSMQLAFELAGRGSKDKYYGVALDTIFLLTDGTPTTPDGKADSTEKILEAVRAWNALDRITIHVIGVGGGINVSFLQQLAQENGGEFRQY